ncbi:MAG: glucose-methanol-choline oxidoreductase [Frankiales bacterium]|nr:glucose-methanol-choline oxidoreductase [Frankiales bacterium]
MLLLEAGDAPVVFPPSLLDARRVPGASPGAATSWAFPALLARDRPWSVTRGKVLGGSTTTNGGYFVRPRPEDADRWSSAGGASWSWDALLPHLRALECDLDLGTAPDHGSSGPVPVRRPALDHPVAAAFVDAAVGSGHRRVADLNAVGEGGIGAVPSNVVEGVRVNAGLAYVLPARARPNLTVVDRAHVHRVVVQDGVATGCVVERDGRLQTVTADEVVLAAGALGSAHLLVLSGIGPARELEALGVPVVHDAPVGGLSDHPQVVLSWRPRPGLPTVTGAWAPAALHTSPGGGPPSGDVEVLLSLLPLEALGGAGPVDPAAPLPLLLSSLAPVRGGRLQVRSTDPSNAPFLDLRYLRTSDDRQQLRLAVRAAVDVVTTPAFREVCDGLVDLDLRMLDDDDALDRWVADHLSTAFHTCGTAPFGEAADPHAVVAPDGRVHGVAGLRVADLSVLPTSPLRGPALTAVLVGEVVAASMT